MRDGIIITKRVTGDIYFMDNNGNTVIPPSKNIEVDIKEYFFGSTLRDAIESAKKYSIGALQTKVSQKMRGHDCFPVVRNIRVSYKIKKPFAKQDVFERLLRYQQGEQILKKGEYGSEFFWIIDGTVDIGGLEYDSGAIFGRAAFGDGIRKMDVYAKTDVSLVAIDRHHPDLSLKRTVISEMFNQERKKIKKARPRAEIECVKL